MSPKCLAACNTGRLPNSPLSPSHSTVTARAYCGTRRGGGRASASVRPPEEESRMTVRLGTWLATTAMLFAVALADTPADDRVLVPSVDGVSIPKRVSGPPLPSHMHL